MLYGKENVVEYLLKTKADPNAADLHGNTALHYAATLGYSNIITLLTQNGGKKDVQNEQNLTPKQLADQQNIVKLLEYEE